MPTVIETMIYKFDELSDTAKERARDWYRSCSESDELTDYDDWSTVAKILGIEFDQRPIKLMGGGTRSDPTIYWSGFSSQGDGACFEGRYAYAAGARKAIRGYASQDVLLHRIADNLQAIQRKHFYRLVARVKHRGHYSHEYCTEIDVTNSETGNDVDAKTAEEVIVLMRDFMQWIYKQLQGNYDWQMSDECVDENILCNEYDFDERGRRA